jgi:hypothetical protein
MIHVDAEPARNLLKIRFSQKVSPEEIRDGLETAKTRLAELQPGFCLLSDLTDLQSMDLRCAPFIEQAMDLYNQKGISRVVRVIPDPQKDIGLNIMSLFHYRRGVRIVTVETLAEAENNFRESES